MAAVEVLLVRHGESEGNLASAAAEAAGAELIDIDVRDADVELSPTGREQATAVGRWLGGLADDQRPIAVWSSPYVRAQQTASIALDTAGLQLPIALDERLRDRELGILDRVTLPGITTRFPAEAERRRFLGKMYYRPPGGESWSDVALRLRSFLRDFDDDSPAARTLVVCHDAVILLVRYVLEHLTEQQLMAIAAQGSVLNGSVTRLRRDAPGEPWQVLDYNLVEHLQQQGAPLTRHEGERDVRPA